jgi:hypothetical protein
MLVAVVSPVNSSVVFTIVEVYPPEQRFAVVVPAPPAARLAVAILGLVDHDVPS